MPLEKKMAFIKMAIPNSKSVKKKESFMYFEFEKDLSLHKEIFFDILSNGDRSFKSIKK